VRHLEARDVGPGVEDIAFSEVSPLLVLTSLSSIAHGGIRKFQCILVFSKQPSLPTTPPVPSV
jgi:hypothetical protein